MCKGSSGLNTLQVTVFFLVKFQDSSIKFKSSVMYFWHEMVKNSLTDTNLLKSETN